MSALDDVRAASANARTPGRPDLRRVLAEKMAVARAAGFTRKQVAEAAGLYGMTARVVPSGEVVWRDATTNTTVTMPSTSVAAKADSGRSIQVMVPRFATYRKV